MPFWQCYFHAVWSTKGREPLITPTIESIIRSILRSKAADAHCEIAALNMVTDHVHVAISIPPSMAPAHLIGEMKGASSHQINATSSSQDAFRWQSAYGLLTVSPKDLPFVVQYVENQKQHHGNQTLVDVLEREDF